jgi:glycosyltransferase involved in cell wall biosynthesis
VLKSRGKRFDIGCYPCHFQSVAKPRVSLVIITLNEAANIERCIRSAPWVDDVVVLDSGSADATVELARECGARTFVEKWRGYRDQKARATELAQNDWILSLDADEALSPEASAELQTLLVSGEPAADGFIFPRLSYNLGRWIRHGGWYPDGQLRFFNRTRANWSKGHVHERVKAERTIKLTHPIYHWPFATHAEQVATNNNYSSLGAQDLFDRGRKFSILKLIFKPISKFIETYVIKLGCLDGLPGFIISVGAAYSVFLKFAKLRELERTQLVNHASSK